MTIKFNFLMQTTAATLIVAASFSAVADNRIRTEVYSANRVYPIYAAIGKATLVQLEDDERLSDKNALVGVGHSEAWTQAVRGNNVIFKPKLNNPISNMIVVTNKRTYAFDLKMANSKNPPTYILRFDYPDTRLAKQVEQRQKQASLHAKQDKAFQILTDSGAVHDAMLSNQLYFGQGNQNLAPSAMWDNGRFTYLKFGDGRDVPTIYRVETDGTETLLNTHRENDTTVIHEVNKKIVLRLGQAVLLIENRGFNPQGTFNHTGTDDNQSVRLLK